MFASPTKRLKVAARPFIRALAASTASRRRLELTPAPRSVPSLALTAASSKSRQTSVKLLTARLSGGDSRCPSSHAPVARLRESLQEQNCWVAELFLELCPLDPNATPVCCWTPSPWLTSTESQLAKSRARHSTPRATTFPSRSANKKNMARTSLISPTV